MTPKNKKISLVLVVLAGVLFAIFLLNQFFPRVEKRTLVSDEARRRGPCPGETKRIDGNGKSYQLLPNWYSCHEVARGDLVYLRFSDQLAPVVKTVYGVPGDHFKLLPDKDHQAWNIEINDKLLVTGDDKKPHFFGQKVPTLLNLYEKTQKGTLQPKNFIVFSENSPGDADSGTLGVVNVDDFIGKVEVIP